MGKFFIMLCVVLLSACVSKNTGPSYEIQNQKFASKAADNGDALFSFIVSVKPMRQPNLKANKKMTSSQYRKMIETEYFSDSGKLKLELEDKAAEMLKQELKQRAYCEEGYTVDDVLWRDYSVRLSGKCLK